MKPRTAEHFDQQFQQLKHLKLKGLQARTIEASARAIRRVGGYLDQQIDTLPERQRADYFTDRVAPGLINPPRDSALAGHRHRCRGQGVFVATRVARQSHT